MDKSHHIMIDLETLSTASNAAILSIGAARFDPYGTEVTDTYEAHIDLEETNLQGFDISASTVGWWLKSDMDEARLYYHRGAKTDLVTALWGFKTWVIDAMQAGAPAPQMWGNGAGFDNVILRRAYELTNQDAPWEFRNDRCFRTMKALFGWEVTPPAEVAPKHSALGDAIWQALYLQRIYRHIQVQK